jgi:NAD(P)-dependent dehydrogenase (short-subunit alcohol dehydrogenase family)
MKDIGRRRVIVMTGGNRGLGKKTIEMLLKSPFR